MSNKSKKNPFRNCLNWIIAVGFLFTGWLGNLLFHDIIKPAVESNEAKTQPTADDMQGWGGSPSNLF